ncbi:MULTISPECIES: type II toxin-antitoxin system RelE/ParE family toxin [unclassified Mesorhizobium]|uniref:type II toxin-antitoxin system RelE/ParE family toxin n=1 Tax=unclassified Mesorhizobium TaxID=325217 RepID=UPI0021E1D8BA|nr:MULTISPECIES: type II toxin-antitoxin system RelE/ParE family toxin [unclassified Mesorhizobium]
MAAIVDLSLLRCATRRHCAGYRHLIVGEYLTLYRVGGDAIEVLRVLHGRRNIEANDLGS